MPGVDVLPEQGNLAHPAVGELFGFLDDLGNRPRHFRAACIGHDAEGAEFVAAFLHRQEGGDAAGADPSALGDRQMLELVLDRIFGVDDALALFGQA